MPSSGPLLIIAQAPSPPQFVPVDESPSAMVASMRMDVFEVEVSWHWYEVPREWWLFTAQRGNDCPWSGERTLALSDQDWRDAHQSGRWWMVTDIGPLHGHIEWHPLHPYVAKYRAPWTPVLRYPTANDGEGSVLTCTGR